MSGFTQLMRDFTDELLRNRDRVGLELVMALANRANSHLITDIGIKRLGEECGRGRKTIEKKLVEFILLGWVKVHMPADEFASPRTLKMLAPDIVMPLSGAYREKAMYNWCSVFHSDISIVTKDHQRYRLDIDTQNRDPNDNQTESQTESHTIYKPQEREGIVTARHYAQKGTTATDNPVGINRVASNAVGAPIFEPEITSLSQIQSVSDLRMQLKAVAPNLTGKEADRYIARNADLVMLAIEAMREAGDSVKEENRTRYFVGVMQRLTEAQTKRAYTGRSVRDEEIPF